MLTDLHIRNLAIIDTLHVSFGPGLNILTGETGAGKSIVIDAVNLVLGGRAAADLIRNGEEEAVVEAIFDFSGRPELLQLLDESGIDCDGDLLVKRTVSRSGRNRVFVGSAMSTLTVLSDLARRFLNIYGQHESQALLKSESHLLLLDGFAGLEQQRRTVGELHAGFKRLQDQLRELEEGEKEALRRLDLLEFQEKEIADAALQPEEEDELERERKLLVHSEKLLQQASDSYETLYGSEANILGTLRRIATVLGDAGRVDISLEPLRERVAEAYATLEDVALELRDYAARVDVDPGRLAHVDDRLDLIRRLKRKYGETVRDVIRYRDMIAAEIEALLNRERTKSGIEKCLAEAGERLRREAGILSAERRKAAVRLSAAMERELRELAMKEALFRVEFSSLDEPRENGCDRVEFLFSPNPGEGLRPLARIASGGELSRLMLALKQVHPESDVPTLVFDEVDSGIGGATSSVVGEKLKEVSRGQQVLCITHLPQVAAFADRHFRVEKRVEGGRTSTSVTLLDDEDRVAELARMSGGKDITETTLRHAREMVASAQCKSEGK